MQRGWGAQGTLAVAVLEACSYFGTWRTGQNVLKPYGLSGEVQQGFLHHACKADPEHWAACMCSQQRCGHRCQRVDFLHGFQWVGFWHRFQSGFSPAWQQQWWWFRFANAAEACLQPNQTLWVSWTNRMGVGLWKSVLMAAVCHTGLGRQAQGMLLERLMCSGWWLCGASVEMSCSSDTDLSLILSFHAVPGLIN